MLIETILALLTGIFAGTITGLIPGIHINLVGALLVSLSISSLSFINPIYLVVFISAMAITHTFIDFIPSIFLGCPDTETVLSVLPGHEMLRNGKGYEAILLTSYGSLAAVFILLFITFPLIFIILKVYDFLRILIPYILIFIFGFMIFIERKKFSTFSVLLITGFLGWSVLNFPENYLKQPLLPLLTGLFGSSMLVLSIKNKPIIPKQKITKPKTNIKKPIIASLIASPLCGFLPGLGSGQAAIIGNTISKTDRKGFLVLLGATNTLVMGFSFIALYTISKTRTGAAAAIKDLIGILETNVLILIIFIVFISGIISFFLIKKLAEFFSKKINKINYSLLSFIILIILIIVVFLISGFFGLIVLIVSTLTGIYCISLGVKRTNMMGCLLIPTILFYLL